MGIMTAPRETKVFTDPYTDLKHAMDSLKNEHNVFRSELKHYEQQAIAIENVEGAYDRTTKLNEFAAGAKALYNQLLTHIKWEEIEFFPLVDLYGGQDLRTLEVLEKEHRLAFQHMDAFFNGLEKCEGPIGAEQAKKWLSDWHQAYFILNEHLNKEEQVLLPYVEQMLTDIEQFYL